MLERRPGVTTIISTLGWNKGPLLAWANKCGLDGRKHREVANTAAQAGTVLHATIDAHLKHSAFDSSGYDAELRAKADLGFQSFLTWKKQVALSVRGTEMKLDSFKHGYRGKLDCVGTIQNGLAVLDWKQSPRVYLEMLIQLAAYGVLWSENFPAEPLSGGVHLLRSGNDGAIDHRHWQELPGAFDVFQRLLEIHKLRARLKGLI